MSRRRISRFVAAISLCLIAGLSQSAAQVTPQEESVRKGSRHQKIETSGKPDQKKEPRPLAPGAEKPETTFRREMVEMPVDLKTMQAVAQAVGTGVYDVGVIPATAKCPQGSLLIKIFMDDEDDNNANSKWGWIGATYHGFDTGFTFCKVDGTVFKPMSRPDCENPKAHYAVLKLGATCPPGSEEFARFFDNEDDYNINTYQGNIYPNVSDRNTKLNFCMFRSGPQTMTDFPDIGVSYGVFAASDFSKAAAVGGIHIDDEDHDNVNTYYAPSWLWSDAQRIISGTRNTDISMARVK